jgi:hypothetical protein
LTKTKKGGCSAWGIKRRYSNKEKSGGMSLLMRFIPSHLRGGFPSRRRVPHVLWQS